MFIKLTGLNGSEIMVNTYHILYMGTDDRGSFLVLHDINSVIRIKETITAVSNYIDSRL